MPDSKSWSLAALRGQSGKHGCCCRHCGRLFAGLLLWFGAVQAVYATADGPDYYRIRGVAAGSVLNARAEPSLTAERIFTIPPAARCLRNLGCVGGLSLGEYTDLPAAEKQRRLRANPRWCKVEFEGKSGWVAGRYLAEAACEGVQRRKGGGQ